MQFSTDECSGLESVAERIEKTITLAQNDINKPGKGGAKRQGKEYIAAIEMLARYFSETFPALNLSQSKNSIFYKYVDIWFSYINKTEKQDISRHIANALNRSDIRLHHI